MIELRTAFATLTLCMALTTSPVTADMSETAVDEINQARKMKGRKALKLNVKLTQAAQKHADELVKRGYGTTLTTGGHYGKNGSKPSQRIKLAGYKACTTVENIAWGQEISSTVIDEWMGSAGHRKNLLNPKIREIGIAFAPPKTWVMVGARPC